VQERVRNPVKNENELLKPCMYVIQLLKVLPGCVGFPR
jgi:hypothetical protein